MRQQTTIIVIIAIYLAAFVSHAWYLKKTVYGDGIFYASWLHSVVIDKDFDFRNEYADMQNTQPLTASGRPGNKYSIGPALLWFPLYVTIYLLFGHTGWEFPYQLSMGITSVLATLFGLVLLLRLFPKNDTVSSTTLLLTAFATNLLFYGAVDPVNSHAVTFFYACILLSLAEKRRVNWFVTGIFLGAIAATRLQDVLFFLLFLPALSSMRILPFGIGFCIFMMPQWISWYIVNGSLQNPYLSGGEGFTSFPPNILGVLFSAENGLFLWTPVVAIGVIGLVRSIRTRWPLLLVFICELCAVASWQTWWQGASISGRMFVSSLPLIAIGLVDIIRTISGNRIIRPILLVCAIALSLLNGIGIIYYLLIH